MILYTHLSLLQEVSFSLLSLMSFGGRAMSVVYSKKHVQPLNVSFRFDTFEVPIHI